MKKQYVKLILVGVWALFFLSGTGVFDFSQAVYAASSEKSAVKTPRRLKPVKSSSNAPPQHAKSAGQSETSGPKPVNASLKASADDTFASEANIEAPASERSESTKKAGRVESSASEEALVFNFDNAELTEVIRTLADLLHINYMLDKGVRGMVTIHTAGKLGREDIFPLFYQILEINGLTAVKENNIYKIMPLKEVSREPVASKMEEAMAMSAGERVVIQVIPLEFVSASEMAKILAPFISADGSIITHESRNFLVVVDMVGNVSKVLRLVKVFDTDIFESVNYRFYVLQYSDVESLLEIMDKLFAAYGEAVKSDTSFIPITRLNALLVVSSNPKAFDAVGSFIAQYDVPSQSTEPGIYVYPLKNGRAADIAGILEKVFTGRKESRDSKGEGRQAVSRNPFSSDAKQEKTTQGNVKPAPPPVVPSTGGDVAMGSATLRGDIHITTDESRNSLIIEAAPADYQIVKNLLKEIDVMPRQVMIEVTFAEITLDQSTSMGVEWSYNKGAENLSTSLIKATMGDSGLNFTIGNPDRWSAALSALATQNKVNILSNPSITASNSIPAKIDISQEIPVASSQYQYTTGTEPLVETNIEYRDTGIMLSVTPNINEQGLVTMEIDQEISEQSTNVSVGGKDYPSFFKRSTETTLTVQSGQTIVIGGLIRETKSDGNSGTPWFTNLPVLSFLFGKTSGSTSKTELVILITPYVIATPDDVDVVTREFTRRISALSLNSE